MTKVKPAYVVRAVDTGDTSLDSAASVLQDALNAAVAEGLTNLRVVPARQHYSVPDPDSMFRDFHYTEVGYLLIGERR